jgi:hypothetical protein
MVRKLLVVAVLVVLFGAVVSTAAAQANDEAVEGIYLSPADTDNGDAYASVDSNGELRVAVSNLNARAVTTIDSVFTITSNQTDTARVWVEPPSGDISFYRMDTGATITTESEAISLDDGETITLGMRVDTRDATPQDGTVTVHALLPEDSSAQPSRSGSDSAPQVTPSTPGTDTGVSGTPTAQPPTDDGPTPSDPGTASPPESTPTQTDESPEPEVGGFPWLPLLGLVAALVLVPLGLFLWRRRRATGLRLEVEDGTGLAVSPGGFAEDMYELTDEALTFAFHETDEWTDADGVLVTLDGIASVENTTASTLAVHAEFIDEAVDGVAIRAGPTTDILTDSVSLAPGESVSLSLSVPADTDLRSISVRCVTKE